MLYIFRKRSIKALAEAAEAYLSKHYVKNAKTSKTQSIPRYSIPAEPAGQEKPSKEVTPSTSGKSNNSADTYIQFQTWFDAGDNYQSDTIQAAMRNLSAGDSAIRAMKTLEEHTNMSFVDKMLEIINKKHLRDSDVYKAALIDRRLFSKMVSDSSYKPSKDTCIALCLALNLSLEEANDLLSRSGYVLSHSNKRDVILEYFFRERVYNLLDINEVLDRLGQKILGRQ